MDNEGDDVVPADGTNIPDEEDGVGFIDSEGDEESPEKTLGMAEIEGIFDEGEEGEGTLFGDSVGLAVGAQCVELKDRKTRQFKFKSKKPESVALENVELGTFAAVPIVK